MVSENYLVKWSGGFMSSMRRVTSEIVSKLTGDLSPSIRLRITTLHGQRGLRGEVFRRPHVQDDVGYH